MSDHVFGLLDETSYVRSDDLASISTAFLPDERRGLGDTQTGEVAVFVNLTNILGRPCLGSWACGGRDGVARARKQQLCAHPPVLSVVWGGGGTLRATRALSSPLISFKPDT